MSLDKALALLLANARAAATAQHLEEVADERQVHYLIGEEIKTVAVPPPRVAHQVDRLDDLVELAGDHPRAELWHSPAGVVLILDAGDRRDRCDVPLPYSERFEALRELEKAAPFDQRRLIVFLRNRLAVEDAIVARFRRLDWTGGGATRSEIGRGKESIGREITAAITQASDMPDVIHVSAPVYTLAGVNTTETVAVAIDTNPTEQTFTLRPMPDELTIAEQRAQQTIREALQEQARMCDPEPPVFAGQP